MNKLSRQYRKFLYYLTNVLKYSVIPRSRFRRCLAGKLRQLSPQNRAAILRRVNYYNKLSAPFELSADAKPNGSLHLGHKNTYILDAYQILRYFDPALKIDYIFGDTKLIPETPRIVKSRPIDGDNRNSILLRLNQVRHFLFVDKDIPFENKKNQVVWRGALGNKKRRQLLLEQLGSNPLCDIGCSDSKHTNNPYYKGFLSIRKQLDFKFILSIEGNEVATNLKWIMSSNSLCMTPKLRFETWFMEGKLIPNHHYVLLKDDYSDLEEKVAYYSEHTDEALEIIRNAHEYVRQFQDRQQEELIGLLVMLKFFRLSNQLDHDGALARYHDSECISPSSRTTG